MPHTSQATRAIALLSLVALPVSAQLPSMRPDVGGIDAAVTSDHVLASAAGMEVIKRGGNAGAMRQAERPSSLKMNLNAILREHRAPSRFFREIRWTIFDHLSQTSNDQGW